MKADKKKVGSKAKSPTRTLAGKKVGAKEARQVKGGRKGYDESPKETVR